MKFKGFLILPCLLALTCMSPAYAQTTDELIAISQIVGQAIDDHDIDTILSNMTEDAVFDTTVWPAPMVGPDQIRGIFQFLYSESPDWGSSEEERGFASGSVVVKEHASTGTNMVLADTGKPWVWPHIDIFDFEGDKVKRLMSYGDYASILVQVGLAPVPEMPDFVPTIPVPVPEPTGLSPLEANINLVGLWNSLDTVAIAKSMDVDAQIFAGPLGAPLDRIAMIALCEMYFAAFPDIEHSVVRDIDLGDGWVVTELLVTGTHQGPFMGIPPMGYPTELRVVWLMRYNADGLLTEGSFYYDNLTLMTQMTTAPYPLDGVWVSSFGNHLFTTVYTAQDAAKTRYSGTFVEINTVSGIGQLFPNADNASKWAGGHVEMVGRNQYDATYLGYILETVETEMGMVKNIVGLVVAGGGFEVLGPDLIQGQGTVSYYMAAQDADHDGFPDEGETPIASIPTEWATKRLTTLP